MPTFRDTLELVLHADASGAIGELKRFSSETEKNVKSSESALKRLSSTGLKIGVAGMGVGGFLTQMADKDVAASNQLKAAMGSAGQSYEDFAGRIDKAVDSQAKFGHTDDEVNNALTTLVGSYGDAGAALDRMQLVADLAAEKHISLADAANIVAKAHGGAGRIFKEFNIQVGQNADGTKNYEGALDQLSQKVSGQASASMAGLTGWLKAAGAEAENLVSDFGQKFGPAILGISTGLTAVSGAASAASTAFKFLKDHSDVLTKAGIATGAALAAAAVYELGTSLNSAADSQDKLDAVTKMSLEDANKYLDTLTALGNSVFAGPQRLGQDFQKIADSGAAGIAVLQQYSDHLHQTGQDASLVDYVLQHAKDSQANFTEKTKEGTKALDDNTDSTKDAQKALDDLTQQTKKAADETQKYKDEVKKLDDAYRNIIDSTLDSFTAALQLSDAQIATRDSLDKLNKAQQDGTTTADELSKKQNDVFEAIINEAQANEKNAEAQKKANGETLSAKDAQAAIVEELLKVADTLAPGSELRKRLEDYINTLTNDVPKKVQTQLDIDASKAFTVLQEIDAFLSDAQSFQNQFAQGETHDYNPLAGIPPGLSLPPSSGSVSPPRITAAFGQVAPQQIFNITATEPVQTAYEIAQHQRAAAFLGN